MKKISIFNAVLAISLIVADTIFIIDGELITKTIASLLFVVLGFVNLIYLLKIKKQKSTSAYLLFLGLCFACLGDIFLEIQFILGAILFAIGHVFYFVSYCKIIKFKWKDLLFSALIFVPSLFVILFVPIFDFGGITLQILCFVYALVISIMVGKATANFIKEKSILNLIILVGSVLFFFSDFMLLFSVFANISSVFRVLCLATYYPAEFMLAYSILKHKKEIKNI